MNKLTLDRRIEIYGVEFNGEWLEIHVDATEERYVIEIFSQSGFVSKDAREFVDDIVSKINC